jgi:hypothetical protein
MKKKWGMKKIWGKIFWEVKNALLVNYGGKNPIRST